MPRIVHIASFADIETEFVDRAHTMVWCSFATVDPQNRVRSRILHPIWEGSTGWIATRRHSPKARDLQHNPHASLAYIADVVRPAYVDCRVEWADAPRLKRHIWELYRRTPPPLGYDPTPIFRSVDDPDFGLLKLLPWRVELGDMQGVTSRVWQA